MGGVGAGGAVDLAEVFGPGDAVQLAGQAVRDDGQFLAQRGGGGGLAVRAGQHRHGTVGLGHRADLRDELAGGGQPDVLHGALDAQGVGEVVDVLGGAAEVHQGGQVFDADAGQPAADVVLHRLDVVHGDGFDVGQFGDRCGVELGDDGAQLLLLLGGQRTGAGQHVVAGQVDEPFDLDGDPVAVEGGLGEVVDQRRDGGLVAAVQRAERDLVVRTRRGPGVRTACGSQLWRQFQAWSDSFTKSRRALSAAVHVTSRPGVPCPPRGSLSGVVHMAGTGTSGGRPGSLVSVVCPRAPPVPAVQPGSRHSQRRQPAQFPAARPAPYQRVPCWPPTPRRAHRAGTRSSSLQPARPRAWTTSMPCWPGWSAWNCRAGSPRQAGPTGRRCPCRPPPCAAAGRP